MLAHPFFATDTASPGRTACAKLRSTCTRMYGDAAAVLLTIATAARKNARRDGRDSQMNNPG
jgi:hypothetical protein